jgi:hypothetical protein
MDANNNIDKMNKLGDLLINQAVPMAGRYRVLFTLKNLGGEEAIKNISKGFQVTLNI